MKDFKYNFLMNSILTLSNFLFPLLTFPYVSRVLEPSGMGIASFAMSIASYFIIFATLGSATYGIRACARVRDDKEQLSKITQEILFINIVSMIFSYVFLILVISYIDKFYQYKEAIYAASLIILLNVSCVDWFYRAIERYSYITIVSLLFKCAALISTFIFITSKNDYIIFIFISVISLSGSGMVNLIELRKHIFFKRYYDYQFKKHLKSMLMFFLMSLSISVYSYTDSVLLGYFKGVDEVGYYNVAIRIKGILLSIVTSLGVVLLPKLSLYITKGMNEEFNKILNLSIRFIVTISIPLIFFSIFFATETILLLSGERFLNSILLLQICSLSIIIVGITNVLGIQILVPLDKEDKLFFSVFIGAVFNIISNVILIPMLSAKGTALSMVLTELIILIIQIIFLRNYLYLFSNISYIKIILSASLSLLFIILINDYLPRNNLVILLISGVGFFIIYLLCLVLMRENIIKEILKAKL